MTVTTLGHSPRHSAFMAATIVPSLGSISGEIKLRAPRDRQYSLREGNISLDDDALDKKATEAKLTNGSYSIMISLTKA